MPFVDDLEPLPLGTPRTTPKGFAVTPGAVDVDMGSDAPDRPSWSSTFGAAFRQDNSTVSWARSAAAPINYDDPLINPWDRIKGTPDEKYWESFVDVHTEGEFTARKQRIAQEEEDRKILAAAPWWQSLPTQMIAGTLDWPTLLPGGAFVRGAKGGFSVARSALNVGVAGGVAATAQEAVLQGTQELRTAGESAVNIGASVLISGLLGAAGSKLLTNVEWNRVVQAVEADAAGLNRAVGGSVDGDGSTATPGALGAAANEPATLEGNTIAGKMAGAVAAATARFNPLLRVTQSPSPVAREVGNQLFENSLYLKKNFEGVASEAAVETLMKEWNAGLASAIRATNDSYPEYRKAGGQLNRDGFREAVGRAMRRLDDDENPTVAKVAKAWRSNIFDPLKEAAIKTGLLPEDVTVETAASYFSRMWNRNRLIALEPEFKNIVQEYYSRVIANEYVKDADGLNQRQAKWDQEISDLRLPADQRVEAINDVDRKLIQLDGKFSGRGIRSKADQISDLQSAVRQANKAGDESASARAKEQIKLIREQGGDDLKAYMDQRAALRSRRGNLELNYAGLKEREAQVLDSLADLEESNIRGLSRLIDRGQVFERELQRIPDDEAIAERLGDLNDRFADLLRREDAAADRIAKLQEKYETEVKKAHEAIAAAQAQSNFAAIKAAQETAQKVEDAGRKMRDALERQMKAQRARMESLNSISARIGALENLPRDEMISGLRDVNARMLAVASDRSLAKGERAARLKERLSALDPSRVDNRIKAIERMKAESERRFFDRWETQRLGQGVDPRSLEPATFREAAREIADHAHASLTGKLGDGVRPEFLKIGIRGPMKERTFNIPDALVEEFLENDVEKVGRRYTRIMGADVELAHKFGKPDMEDQLAKVREDFKRLRDGVTSEKELTRLGEQESAAIRDLKALRDLLRGVPMDHPLEGKFNRITRAFNHLNYIRSMGEVVLASLMDAVRPAMVHGLSQYMATTVQLATNLKGIKASVREGQLAGNIGERVLGSRLATISEIIDPHASRGPVEAFLENMTNVASKWNGIRMWTDWMKAVASVMTQDRILSGVSKFDGIKPKERAYLAYLTIDQSMAERIAKQFSQHGEDIDGVRVANTEEWTDPVAVRRYRAAINKDVDSIIVTKSVADVPLFASTPTGRAMLQFKTFALASHQRVLLRGLQEDQARFVGGLIAMTAMGMFVTWAKSVSGNREDRTQKFAENPGWWIGEGLDRTGVLSVPMELSNVFEKMTGLNPIKSPVRAFDENSAISQKNQNRNLLGSIIGPTGGMIEDVGVAAGIPKTALDPDKDVTQGQWNSVERLFPFNSYLGLRQMIRYLVNERE